MATEIRLTKEDIKLIMQFGSRATDSVSGTSYYHLPDWFAVEEGSDSVRRLFQSDLPEWVKDFSKTPSENLKDQRINELEELLSECEVLAFQDDIPDYITKWQEYLHKVSDYRLKYNTTNE